MKCNNCEKEVDINLPDYDKSIVVRHEGIIGVVICADCTKDVKVTKIVLTRERSKDRFEFDTLLNVETFK